MPQENAVAKETQIARRYFDALRNINAGREVDAARETLEEIAGMTGTQCARWAELSLADKFPPSVALAS